MQSGKQAIYYLRMTLTLFYFFICIFTHTHIEDFFFLKQFDRKKRRVDSRFRNVLVEDIRTPYIVCVLFTRVG